MFDIIWFLPHHVANFIFYSNINTNNTIKDIESNLDDNTLHHTHSHTHHTHTPKVHPFPILHTRHSEMLRAFRYYKYHMLGTALCWFLLDVDFYANNLFNHDITASILSTQNSDGFLVLPHSWQVGFCLFNVDCVLFVHCWVFCCMLVSNARYCWCCL